MGEVCHAMRSATLRAVSTPDATSTAESPAPIALGPTLELGWQLFKRSLPRCLPLAVLAVLIGQLPAVYLLNIADRGVVWLLLNALAAIAGLALWLLIMQRQYALLHGRISTLGRELEEVIGALPRAVGVLVVTLRRPPAPPPSAPVSATLTPPPPAPPSARKRMAPNGRSRSSKITSSCSIGIL